METINLVAQQLREGTDAEAIIEEYPDFFTVYFRAFDHEKPFRRDLPKALKRARQLHDTAGNVERIMQACTVAEATLQPLFEKLLPREDVEPRLYLFIGRGMWDGHGLVGGKEPSMFFDMTLVNEHLSRDNFSLEVHFVHELVHALHYHLSPEFFPAFDKAHRRITDQFVAEGLATCVCREMTGCGDRQALWFGSLNEDQFDEWRKHARNWRQQVADDIQTLLQKGDVEDADALNEKLFRIPGQLQQGRVGYLYGTEVVESVRDSTGDWECLRWSREQWNRQFQEYFDRRGSRVEDV